MRREGVKALVLALAVVAGTAGGALVLRRPPAPDDTRPAQVAAGGRLLRRWGKGTVAEPEPVHVEAAALALVAVAGLLVLVLRNGDRPDLGREIAQALAPVDYPGGTLARPDAPDVATLLLPPPVPPEETPR